MMQAGPRHPLIEDYLVRLAAAAEPLHPARRGELLDDIREHLREALPGADPATGDVRRVLDRLGDPATSSPPPGAIRRPSRHRRRPPVRQPVRRGGASRGATAAPSRSCSRRN